MGRSDGSGRHERISPTATTGVSVEFFFAPNGRSVPVRIVEFSAKGKEELKGEPIWLRFVLHVVVISASLLGRPLPRIPPRQFLLENVCVRIVGRKSSRSASDGSVYIDLFQSQKELFNFPWGL